MSDDEPKLGPCCMCETTGEVVVVVMLSRRGLVPGHGWGCVVCDLPMDGALAVLCEPCAEIYAKNETALRFACRGYPASEGRVPLNQLPEGVFDHDLSKHKEDEG